jgi:hypothetical protein
LTAAILAAIDFLFLELWVFKIDLIGFFSVALAGMLGKGIRARRNVTQTLLYIGASKCVFFRGPMIGRLVLPTTTIYILVCPTFPWIWPRGAPLSNQRALLL